MLLTGPTKQIVHLLNKTSYNEGTGTYSSWFLQAFVVEADASGHG